MERHLNLQENQARISKDVAKHLKKLENSLKEGETNSAQFDIEQLKEAMTKSLIRCDFEDKGVFD